MPAPVSTTNFFLDMQQIYQTELNFGREKKDKCFTLINAIFNADQTPLQSYNNIIKAGYKAGYLKRLFYIHIERSVQGSDTTMQH